MIVAMIALAVTLSGTAMAGTAKLITSSSQIKNGSIRLVDMNPFAIAALKGERGATGAQGATGTTGDVGAAGEKGETGATGATGAAGPQGAVGATGLQGPQGERGPAGIVDATKARVCVDTSTGAMTFMPGEGPTGPCGMGKQIINIYMAG